jgi:hypothetical protein
MTKRMKRTQTSTLHQNASFASNHDVPATWTAEDAHLMEVFLEAVSMNCFCLNLWNPGDPVCVVPTFPTPGR